MNTKIISSFILTSAAVILAAGCCPSTKVNTLWGTQVYVFKCIQQIKYSGNSFKIGEATIPFGLEKVIIKGVEWDTKKLQDAAPAIQAMEQTRLRLCEERVIDMQTLKYEDYLAKDKKRQENQEKLDQLAYLVTFNNPQAVEKWIDKYLIKVIVSNEKAPADLSMTTKAEETLRLAIEFKMIPNDNASVQEISTFLK
ncbi:MAG: hypothetical protein KJ739_09805 [Nitrospinae bacterium]|nr:hypothetical protein [Nitrospinota bacterium]